MLTVQEVAVCAVHQLTSRAEANEGTEGYMQHTLFKDSCVE